MSANAFSPHGNSAALSVTSTSTTTPIQVKGDLNNATQRLIYNAGPNDCFLVAKAASADAVAVAPVAGTPANGIPIAAGAVLTLSFPPNSYFAAICASTKTATLYITPGEAN